MAKINKPTDCDYATKKYGIEKGGICGQACIAIITGQTIREVLEEWQNIGLEWKGWSGWNQIKKFLKHKGYSVKQVNGLYNPSPSIKAICRVQWLGKGTKQDKPYYGYNHWSEASAHTHFILETDEQFFCNEDGIFPIEELPRYMRHYDAVITSRMAVGNTNK